MSTIGYNTSLNLKKYFACKLFLSKDIGNSCRYEQDIDLQSKWMDWFLYHRDLCLERVKLFKSVIVEYNRGNTRRLNPPKITKNILDTYVYVLLIVNKWEELITTSPTPIYRSSNRSCSVKKVFFKFHKIDIATLLLDSLF